MATDFYTLYTDANGVKIERNEENGLSWAGKCATSSIPSAKAGYAVGCTIIATDTGIPYFNTGSTVSCTFTSVGAL